MNESTLSPQQVMISWTCLQQGFASTSGAGAGAGLTVFVSSLMFISFVWDYVQPMRRATRRHAKLP
jgi:hypothetical protein